MAVKHYTLTLSGAAQRLSQVYSSGANNAQPSAAQDLPYRQVILQADPANAAVVYLGGDSGVSSTNHGASLDPTQATAQDRVSLGPFETGPVKLSDLWVLGTASQRLMVLVVPY